MKGDSGIMSLDLLDIKYGVEEYLIVLEKFYKELYETEFPDINERESLENMISSLSESDKDIYKILIARDGDFIKAGIVFNYLSEEDTLIIEFIVVNKEYREVGLTKAILLHVYKLFPSIRYSIAEVNNPLKVKEDTFDPKIRLNIWRSLGYRILNFSYIQPSLGEGKDSVEYLLLLCYSREDYVDSDTLINILRGYASHAMRIEDPCKDVSINRMMHQLKDLKRVTLL
jgi:hypothetical protein